MIEGFTLKGPAGRLECFLKSPPGDGAPAAAVVCHPHPLFGGSMHNKVVFAAARALAQAGLPVVRFNFRGVGLSEGEHDGGRGERADLAAVLDHLERLYPGAPLVVAGYSFGAWVGLSSGCSDPRVTSLIGIGVPAALYDFRFLAGCSKSVTIIQGDRDPFGPLPLVMRVASVVPGGCRVVPIPGAGHDFNGALDALASRVAGSLAADS